MSEEIKQKIVERLKRVYDPEIPIDVWNLGLIYDIKVEDHDVKVKMTLTAPGCPIAYLIVDNVRRAVLEVEGIKKVDVELVWEPKWSPLRMTDEGREMFKAVYGYDIVEAYKKKGV